MDEYRVGFEGGAGSQPIKIVSEMGPGVVHGVAGERGTPAHIVHGDGPGVQYVYLENATPDMLGVPPMAFGGRDHSDPDDGHIVTTL